MKTSKGKSRMHPARKRSKDRQLVLLDQRPLRCKAASECSRAMARLEKAKAQWKRFQQEDQAAFKRWVAATFGALLSRVREIEAAVQAREALIQDVEMEMVFGGARSPRAAYGKVQHQRNNPQPEPDPQAAPPPRSRQDEEEFTGDPFGDIPEFEQEMLFEEFLRAVMGLNPDRMSEKNYQKMFADFKANVFGHERREQQPAPQSPPSAPSRLKELYRLLVRRLHPDTRAGSDAGVSAIWHEVQEAYGDGNIERLEMLLAMTDLQANAAGEHTSLSQMQAVLAELRRSFNALQRNLRDAKKDLAWNFCDLQDRSILAERVRSELESRFRGHERILSQLDARIAQWAAPPKARKKPTARYQADFFF